VSILEDELQNVEMAEEDRRKKNQELKIKRRDYTGYDDEEFEPGKVGIRRGVLSKYDNVIDGEKTMVCDDNPSWSPLLIVFQEFRLGGSMKAPNQKIIDQDEVTAVSVNKSLLSVDYASTSSQHSEELDLTPIVQRTSKFLTTSRKVMLGSRNLRSVSPDYLLSVAYHSAFSEEEAPQQQARHRILYG